MDKLSLKGLLDTTVEMLKKLLELRRQLKIGGTNVGTGSTWEGVATEPDEVGTGVEVEGDNRPCRD